MQGYGSTLVCQGRDLDRNGQSVGRICGTVARARAAIFHNRVETTDEFHSRVRVEGWRIGYRADGTPDALCPTCAKPDPALVRLTRELAQSVE